MYSLRTYDPTIGRWLQQDPYNEFFSPYCGMGNNPANLVDHSGGDTWFFTSMGVFLGKTNDNMGNVVVVLDMSDKNKASGNMSTSSIRYRISWHNRNSTSSPATANSKLKKWRGLGTNYDLDDFNDFYTKNVGASTTDGRNNEYGNVLVNNGGVVSISSANDVEGELGFVRTSLAYDQIKNSGSSKHDKIVSDIHIHPNSGSDSHSHSIGPSSGDNQLKNFRVDMKLYKVGFLNVMVDDKSIYFYHNLSTDGHNGNLSKVHTVGFDTGPDTPGMYSFKINRSHLSNCSTNGCSSNNPNGGTITTSQGARNTGGSYNSQSSRNLGIQDSGSSSGFNYKSSTRTNTVDGSKNHYNSGGDKGGFGNGGGIFGNGGGGR